LHSGNLTKGKKETTRVVKKHGCGVIPAVLLLLTIFSIVMRESLAFLKLNLGMFVKITLDFGG